MDLALIPPISLLTDTELTHTQLMLPQLAYKPFYAAQYDRLRARGDYIILDNGAAENELVDDGLLIAIAYKFNVDEIAIPDVLADSDLTCARAFKFLRVAQAHADMYSFKLGLVAQGNTIHEALETIRTVIHSRAASMSFLAPRVIYLPRLLLATTRDPEVRLKLAVRIKDEFGDEMEVHLFGASPYWPGEVCYAAAVPEIRSMDTSMPYNYAFERREMDPAYRSIGLVKRPKDYFNLNADHFQDSSRYVGTYMDWARGA